MKRSAENQLTKDSREDDDEIVEEGTGFKAASQEAMAGRKIKGLPKRRGAGATPTPSTPSEVEPPKSIFGGFAGFGGPPAATSNGTSDSGAAKSSGFAGFGGFGASTTPAVPTSTTGPSSLFGTTASAPSKTSQLFGASIAAASSSLSQTNGTTSGSSFSFKPPAASSTTGPSASSAAPSASPFSFGGPPSSSPAAAPKFTASSSGPSGDSSVEYFLSLRGLNNSLLAAIESAIAKDPFAKLPVETIAAAYAKHWSDIEAKAKAPTSTDVEMKPPAAETAKPAPSSTTTSSTPAPPTFTMPKPPVGGFSFGTGASGAASTSSTTIPSFNFGAKPSESPSPEKSNSSNPSAFSFKPPAGGFTFGSQSTPAAAPLFGAKADSGAPSSTGAPTNIFGSTNLFGAPKPKDADSDSKKSDDKDMTDASGPKSLYPFSALDSKSPTPTPVGPKPNPPTFFSFGSTPATTPTHTPGTPDPAEKKPAFSFSFGAGKAGSFTFGAATPGTSTPSSGSLGNPVGFSFGAPVATGAATPTPGTTAGLEAAKAAHDPDSKPEGSAASVISQTPAESLTPAPESTDIVGAGEENEETLISERGKAYKLKDGSWTDIGTGHFKIKKDKDTGMKRVLMRPEHGGNIILNFRFHPDLNPRPGQKPVNLTLVAIDDGKPLNIVMRFTSGDATQRVLNKLKEVLETP